MAARRPAAPHQPAQLDQVLGRELRALVGAPELADVEPAPEVLVAARARPDRIAREALAIEESAALAAGELGFYARLLAQCTLPHRPHAGAALERVNGRLRLSIMAPPSIGLPSGRYPRLLLSWLTGEAVRTRSPHLELGASLSSFMRELGLSPTGGREGTIGRLRDQARRLFASSISCAYSGASDGTGAYEEAGFRVASRTVLWWSAGDPDQVALWGSHVQLTDEFFRAIVDRPIPVDLRALRALQAPLGLDLYVWLTWRVSFLRAPVEIPWGALAQQFGADYRHVRQFRFAALRHLRQILKLYPALRLEEGERGLVVRPSAPHVARLK